MEANSVALMTKSKDEFYTFRTILLLGPNSVLAWLEVFACENYLKPMGGHAIYDLALPVTTIIYFVIVVLHFKHVKKIE